MPTPVEGLARSNSLSDTGSNLSLQPCSSESAESEEDDPSADNVNRASASAFARLKSLLQQRDSQLSTDQQERPTEPPLAEANEKELLIVRTLCTHLLRLCTSLPLPLQTSYPVSSLHSLSRSYHDQKTGASKPQMLLNSQTTSLRKIHKLHWAVMKALLQTYSNTPMHPTQHLLSHLPSCFNSKHRKLQIEQHSANINSIRCCCYSKRWQSSSMPLVGTRLLFYTAALDSECCNNWIVTQQAMRTKAL